MSTTVTTYGEAPLRASAKPAGRFRRAIERFIQSREEQGRRRVLAYLSGLSDERLAGLGYDDADIRQIRNQQLPWPRAYAC